MNKPLILSIADNVELNNMPAYMIRKQYIRAAHDIAKVTPIILPSLVDIDISSVLSKVSGILLTGSASNIHPTYYNYNTTPCLPLDTARDEVSFKLINLAIEKSLPILAICRGMQELNIALGGSLAVNIQDKANNMNHSAAKTTNSDEEFAIKQDIIIKENSLLHKITKVTKAKVNSLHSQAIEYLASNLIINATAPDGIIEAVNMKNKKFVLGVQFHPEYWVHNDKFSNDIFVAFGKAVYNYNKVYNKND